MFLLVTMLSVSVVSFASNSGLNVKVSSSEYSPFQNSKETNYPRSPTYNLRHHPDGVSSFSSPLYVLDPPLEDATDNTNIKHSVLLVKQNPKYDYNIYPHADDGKEYIYSELQSPGYITENVRYSNQGYIIKDKTSMSTPLRHSTPVHLDHDISTFPDSWRKSSNALTHTPNKVTTRLSDSLDQIKLSSQDSWNQRKIQLPETKYELTTRQPVQKRHPETESFTSNFSTTRIHNSVKNTRLPSENIVLTSNHKPSRSNFINPPWRNRVGEGLNKESTNGLLNIFNHQKTSNHSKSNSFEHPKYFSVTTPTLINSEYLSTPDLETSSPYLSQHQESTSEITPPKFELQLEPVIALSDLTSSPYTAAKWPSLTMSKSDVGKMSYKSEGHSSTSDITSSLNSDTKPADNDDGKDPSVISPKFTENVSNSSHELNYTQVDLLSSAVHFPVSNTKVSLSKKHDLEDSSNLLSLPDSLATSDIVDPIPSTTLLSPSTDSSSETSSNTLLSPSTDSSSETSSKTLLSPSTDSSSETFQSDASKTDLSSAIESPSLISLFRFFLVGIMMMMVPSAFTEINAIVSSLATG